MAVSVFAESFQEFPPEFKELTRWIWSVKQTTDVVLIGDGRSDIARTQIRDLLKEAVGDAFTELWVPSLMAVTAIVIYLVMKIAEKQTLV